MAKKHRLEILAVLKDELSVPLKRINKALNLTNTGSKKVKTSATGAAKGLDKVGRSAAKAQRRTSGLYQGIKRLSRGLSNLKFLAGAALAAFGVYAMARLAKGIASITMEVEKLTAEIGTLVGGRTKENLEDLSFAIRHMAVMGGQTLKDEFGAAYDAISAGMPKERLLEFLAAANSLAIGGVTDVATATNLLTSVMNSFNIDMDDMDDVLDSLFQTVKFGKLRITDLANSIGRVAPIAQKAGMTLDEMNAAIATLTISGLKTEEATTALRQLLATLIDMTPQATKRLQEMGLEDVFSLAAMRSKGFAKFIVDLSEGVKGREEELASFIGNIRALTGALSLVSNKGEKILYIMEGFTNKQGAAAAATELVTNTLGHQIERLKALKDTVLVDIGNLMFGNMVEPIREFVDGVEDARVAIWKLQGAIAGDKLGEVDKEKLTAQLEAIAGGLRSVLDIAIIGSIKLISKLLWTMFKFVAGEFGRMLYNSISGAIRNWATENPLAASALGLEGGLSQHPGVRGQQLEQLSEAYRALSISLGDVYRQQKSELGRLDLGTDMGKSITHVFKKALEGNHEGSYRRKLAEMTEIAARSGLADAWEYFMKQAGSSTRRKLEEGQGLDIGGRSAGYWGGFGDEDSGARGRHQPLLEMAFVKALVQETSREVSSFEEAVLAANEAQTKLARESGRDAMTYLDGLIVSLKESGGVVENDLAIALAFLAEKVKEVFEQLGGPDSLVVGLEDVTEESTFTERAVRGLADAFTYVGETVAGTLEKIKRLNERLEQLKAQAEIDILKALGLKDAAEILEIRADIAKLITDFEKLSVLDIAGRQQVTDAIMIKELELARLQIQLAMNSAMKRYKDAIKAANDAKKAGETTGGDYRGSVKDATDAYNTDLKEQMAILDQLALRYPQATAAIEEFRLTLKGVSDLSSLLKFQWGDADDALEGFVSGLGASKNVLNSVGQAIGNRLGSAIDGLITGTKTLGQAFREMAIGIVQDIAKIIVKMLILQALNMMFPGMGFAAGAGMGAAGANTGGLIRRNLGGLIPGFSRGGFLPRFGPDRDSIPAMLTPGEFVIRRSAVDKYGIGLLTSINNMMAPKNLAGMAKSAAKYRGSVQGYNSGGAVSGGSGQAAGPQPSYIVANERSMQSLLTGGKAAMLEFLRQNRGSFAGNARGGAR